jgi:RNA polymerase sigma-54 factor
MEPSEHADEIIDLIVELTEAGDFKVLIPNDGLSVLSIDQRFMHLCQEPTIDPRKKEYLERKINHARQFMEAIQERRKVLTRIARLLFRHQCDFLERGPNYIVPLSIQEIATEAGVFASRVSAALRAKRVQTPHGIFALEDFVVHLPKPSEN